MGFYYGQQVQQNGFYYDHHQSQQEQEGFYYGEEQGFYYDQQQKGFYYEGFYYNQMGEGFYYDQEDKFNKENKDYWYKGAGRERVVKALDGLRSLVDGHVIKNPHAANDTQGRALSNVVTIQVVREVIKKFVKNVNPAEFFKNKGTDKSLATLLAKECQNCLGPCKIYNFEFIQFLKFYFSCRLPRSMARRRLCCQEGNGPSYQRDCAIHGQLAI